MKSRSASRILLSTLIAMTLIATYVILNSYYTQVAIYEEKELFKLDCIANAVAYKISGDEHEDLVTTYPSATDSDSVITDERYVKIHEQIAMAQMMTKLPSSMQTIIKDTSQAKYFFAVSTRSDLWLDEASETPAVLDTMFDRGGIMGRYQTPEGDMLGALSPVMNAKGEVVSTLHVEETFDSFLKKARDHIYFNLLISAIFILVIGGLMFFSVRTLLARQQKLVIQKQEIEAMRKELLANVSHDLRTPLASIQGYVETLLLKNGQIAESERRQYLETTLKSTEKLRTLVDELFELSRLESKERKLQLEVFNWKELTHDVVNHFKVHAADKNITIHLEMEDNVPSVKADIALIDRVMQNLLGNAINYCDSSDEIFIRLKTKGQSVQFEIEDTGPGIPQTELSHLFDRFRRGKTLRSGTGLGLAIVKSALELHGSQCLVESAEGKGTTFRFSLTIA